MFPKPVFPATMEIISPPQIPVQVAILLIITRQPIRIMKQPSSLKHVPIVTHKQPGNLQTGIMMHNIFQSIQENTRVSGTHALIAIKQLLTMRRLAVSIATNIIKLIWMISIKVSRAIPGLAQPVTVVTQKGRAENGRRQHL